MDWEDLLAHVEKPSRYLGTEINALRPGREAELHFALAFPDTYEVGMSHLGIQILYELLNGIPGLAAERCFAPWPDMEKLLRQRQLPLTSLESHRPLHAFDILGFSLQYELSYTNVLNMLELGGIPLLRIERRNTDPLIIAGGPCTFNPAPMEDFIDVFVIGEGEAVIGEIAATALKMKRKGASRTDTLAALAEIAGLYVPAFYQAGTRIRKRLVSDLNQWPLPTRPVVPLMKTIHDRITLEIARGCTRGCRFCQAGMVWRPVRERHQEEIEVMAAGLLCATGYDEISLLSLSTGDYSRIEPLLATLMERYYEQRVALGLPSLRVETLTRGLIENIRRVRKTSFTLAPEAGTQRLRNLINKGNTAAELLSTTEQVFAAGWKAVKLYFMLGLPGEEKEDMEGIAELAYQVLRTGKQQGQVTVSLSTFVPKPHTPFQWERQLSQEETKEKQLFIKNSIRHRNIKIKWHDSRMSLLEGIFARGDAHTGRLLAAAFRLGCRFDGWTDLLRFNLWEQAMDEVGFTVAPYLAARDPEGELPWDRIDCGVERSFLLAEARAALAGEATPDCRTGLCQNCGVCDHETIRIITAAEAVAPVTERVASPAPAAVPPTDGESAPNLLRLKFRKHEKARFLSHAELVEALIRAVKRSGLNFLYSQGYHPHPKISFAFATSTGMESREEYADLQVTADGRDHLQLQRDINALLPQGLEIMEINAMTYPAASLASQVTGFSYAIALPPAESGDLVGLSSKIAAFLQSDSVIITRETKEKRVVKDIRPFVSGLALNEEKCTLLLQVRMSSAGTVRPQEILRSVLGLSHDAAQQARIVKTATLWATGKSILLNMNGFETTRPAKQSRHDLFR